MKKMIEECVCMCVCGGGCITVYIFGEQFVWKNGGVKWEIGDS